MLFLYAVAFSFAYLSLSTATGALILFGAVQLTLLALTFFTGFKLSPLEWLGLLLACFGFTYLMLPGINAPSVSGFLLMTLAGIAWGGYTFLGRSSTQPLLDTAANFTRTLPLAIIILIFILLYGKSHLTTQGVVLAIASGSVASGIGYAIWYKALASLSTTQAGIVQLLVPVIAAFGGVIFVSEPVTMRLLIASFLILGGIACVFFSKYFYNKN